MATRFTRLVEVKELFNHFYTSFYIEPIIFFVGAVGLVISIKKRTQNPKLKPLIFFFLGYIVGSLIYYFTIAAKIEGHLNNTIFYYTDFADTAIEFLTFFLVIKNYIVNDKIKKALDPLLYVFVGSVLFFLLAYKISLREIDQYFLQTVFTIEALVLIIACILYYIDLFKQKPDLNFTAAASFWAVTGVLFFMLCTLPFFKGSRKS